MKRVLSVMVCCVVLLGAFVGCSSKKDPSSSTPASNIVGGYSEDRELTVEDRELFDTAMGATSSGRTYETLKVATQVVAGTNYRFTVIVDDNGTKYDAHIFIFKPLDGDPEFVSEEKI